VTVAVLGCGSIGRRHLDNLTRLGVAPLLAFDPNPATRDRLEPDARVDCVESLDDVWRRQPAAVIVASPTDCHLAQAVGAVAHGAHVFVEKPVSHTLDGVAELARAAQGAGLTTMVGCNMRFHPGPATMKRLLADGAIGRPLAARLQTSSYLPDWRPGGDYRASYSADPACGGAILDCIHEIDLALWYFGGGRLEAAAVRPASSIGLDVDGLAELLIAHDSGVVSSVHLSFVQRDYRRLCQIAGDEGTLYWDFAEPVVRIARGRTTEAVSLSAEWSINHMYVDELAHFLAAAAGARETMCPIVSGQAALAIALAARRTAAVESRA
jgi:predicted dehydrogenase